MVEQLLIIAVTLLAINTVITIGLLVLLIIFMISEGAFSSLVH